MNELSVTYNQSWALLIGIDDYESAPPLIQATRDAQGVEIVLRDRFDFPEGNLTILLNGAATRQAIWESFSRFTRSDVSPDDRLLIFFAGHGHTREGARGEIGFLVPADGRTDAPETLIRWDDFTKGSDLIPAKHILFVMDACYSGLIVNRSLPPGSTRFLEDVMRRRVRQVLTAGKRDQPVSDSGGSRPGHSIFTSYLLDALYGAVEAPDGILLASSIMPYVCEKVAKDPNSSQTPHYGNIEGDGEFVFLHPPLEEKDSKSAADEGLIIEVPASLSKPEESPSAEAVVERAKEYVSETRFRIHLDDLVSREIRSALRRLGPEEFPLTDTQITAQAVGDRLKGYELALDRLMPMFMVICKWGAAEHRATIERVVSQVAEVCAESGQTISWLGLEWHALNLLMYAGGIAAVSSHEYENLLVLFKAPVHVRPWEGTPEAAIMAYGKGTVELERSKALKSLPIFGNNYNPRSEYLFKNLQPMVEDHLSPGRSYSAHFDRFEVLLALQHADIALGHSDDVWAPLGRFGWKHKRGHGDSPYDSLVREAESAGGKWPPIRAGLLGGSFDRFDYVARQFRERILQTLNWF